MLEAAIVGGGVLLAVGVAILLWRRRSPRASPPAQVVRARTPSPPPPSQGDAKALVDQAVQAYVRAGDYERAAALYETAGDPEGAAAILVQGGRWEQAAESLTAAGRPKDAARVLEDAGQLARAAVVWLEAGEAERAAGLYERLGDAKRAADLRASRVRQATPRERWTTTATPRTPSVAMRVGPPTPRPDVGPPLRRATPSTAMPQAQSPADEAQRLLARGDYLGAGRIFVQLGDFETASRAFQRGGDDALAREAAAAAQRQAGLAPPGAARVRGPARVAVGPTDAERAEDHLRSRLAEASNLAREGRYLEAAELYEQESEFREAARWYFRAGDLPRSIRYLTELEDWLTLGRVHLQAGETDQARGALAKVDRQDPRGWRKAQLKLADLERMAGRVAEAAGHYEELVKDCLARQEEPEQTQRWSRCLAELRIELGDREGAIECLERLAEHGLLSPELKQHLDRMEGEAQGFQAEKTVFDRAIGNTMLLVRHPRYEFVEKLGQGGNGVVYRARDRMLGRQLVIKMILESSIPTEVARQWFMREAKLAAMLNHDNIVTIYDLGEIEGQLFIAMELLQGQDLETRLADNQDEPLDPRFIVEVYRQLCGALQYAHDQGTVHRDIKLENVMITTAGKVKLMDFGLANALGGSEDSMMIVGTPMYMAPEVVSGRPADHRIDIYAMGVMLYVLLTADWPFDPEGVFEQHLRAPVPDPRGVHPPTPAGFVPIIQKAMAKRPEDRYQRIEQMYDAMAAVPLAGAQAGLARHA